MTGHLEPRALMLAAVAALLALALLLRDQLAFDAAPRSTEAVKARIETLRRTLAGRDEVAARYAELAAILGERLAGMETYDPVRKADARAVEALIRTHLGDPNALQDLSIVPSGSEELGDGITRLTFDVSFATLSDRQAAQAVSAFAKPEAGLAWETFNLSADRRDQKLTVTGKIAALLIGPVE